MPLRQVAGINSSLQGSTHLTKSITKHFPFLPQGFLQCPTADSWLPSGCRQLESAAALVYLCIYVGGGGGGWRGSCLLPFGQIIQEAFCMFPQIFLKMWALIAQVAILIAHLFIGLSSVLVSLPLFTTGPVPPKKKMYFWELPGGLMVRIWPFHCCGPGSIWSVNWDPTSWYCMLQTKKKKKKKTQKPNFLFLGLCFELCLS